MHVCVIDLAEAIYNWQKGKFQVAKDINVPSIM